MKVTKWQDPQTEIWWIATADHDLDPQEMQAAISAQKEFLRKRNIQLTDNMVVFQASVSPTARGDH